MLKMGLGSVSLVNTTHYIYLCYEVMFRSFHLESLQHDEKEGLGLGEGEGLRLWLAVRVRGRVRVK